MVATQVRLDWLRPVIAALDRKDPDIDAVDWGSLRDDLAARDLLRPGTIVGVPNWRDAGKIAYAVGPDMTTLCLSRDCRQFGFAWPPERFIDADVLILAPEHSERVVAELGPAFDSIEQAGRCFDPPCRAHVADGGGVPGAAAARLAASRVMA